MNRELNLEFIGQIIDIFEDFLEERGVTLPNDEREQDEDAAIIYGTDYSQLQTELIDTMRNWGIEVKDGWEE
jgi:hypothetical protein